MEACALIYSMGLKIASPNNDALNDECVMTLSYWCHFSSLIFDESVELESTISTHTHTQNIDIATISTLHAYPCHSLLNSELSADDFYVKRGGLGKCVWDVEVEWHWYIRQKSLIWVLNNIFASQFFSSSLFLNVTWIADNDGDGDGDDDGRCSTHANRSLV